MRRLRPPAVAPLTPLLSAALLLTIVAGAWCMPLERAGAAAAHALLGQPAPDFALRSAAGVNLRLSEHRGEVVMLSFWGSRCSTCRPQLAALDALQATYGTAGLVTLGVGVDDDLQRAHDFVAGVQAKFPLLLDPEKKVARAYDVDALPMTLLIDRAGTVRFLHRDYRSGAEAQYLQELKSLLDE